MSKWTFPLGFITFRESETTCTSVIQKLIESAPKITGSEGDIEPLVLHDNSLITKTCTVIISGSLRDRISRDTLNEIRMFAKHIEKHLPIVDYNIIIRTVDDICYEVDLNYPEPNMYCIHDYLFSSSKPDSVAYENRTMNSSCGYSEKDFALKNYRLNDLENLVHCPICHLEIIQQTEFQNGIKQ